MRVIYIFRMYDNETNIVNDQWQVFDDLNKFREYIVNWWKYKKYLFFVIFQRKRVM